MLKNVGEGIGTALVFADDPSLRMEVTEKLEGGEYRISITSDEPAESLLERLGRLPLPPYIKREKDHDERDELDRERYQTVFARSAGAVAAPTAGLHFSGPAVRELDAARRAADLRHASCRHRHVQARDRGDARSSRDAPRGLHDRPAAAEAINAAKREGRRVIAVGTTAARVLESQPAGWPFDGEVGRDGDLHLPAVRVEARRTR